MMPEQAARVIRGWLLEQKKVSSSTPIVTSASQIEKRLNALLKAEVPKLVKMLEAEWVPASYGITDAELRRIAKKGQYPSDWPDRFAKRYATFVNKRMAPLWAKAQSAGVEALGTGTKRAASRLGVDLLTPKLDLWSRTRAGEQITALTKGQLTAFRSILHQHTVVDPLGERSLSKLLRPLIGLQPRQAKWLAARRAALVAKGVPIRKREVMLARTAAKWRKQRARLIARTELATAYNAAMNDSVAAIHEAGGFEEQPRKRWFTMVDERVCTVCGPLHDTLTDFEGSFQAKGKAVALPPAHPGCRCLILYETTSAKVEVDEPDLREENTEDVTEAELDAALKAEEEAMPTSTRQLIGKVNAAKARYETVLNTDVNQASAAHRVWMDHRTQLRKELQEHLEAAMAEVKDDAETVSVRQRFRRGAEVKDAYSEWTDDYMRMVERSHPRGDVRKEMHVDLKRTKTRAYCGIDSKHSSGAIKGEINLGDSLDGLVYAKKEASMPSYERTRRELNAKATLFHELGHYTEMSNLRIAQASRLLYDRRTRGEALAHLGSGYSKREVTRRDKWFHAYVGKEYSKTIGSSPYSRSTEIVSMGLEQLSDPVTMANLALIDMEHYLYMMTIVRGRYGWRK